MQKKAAICPFIIHDFSSITYIVSLLTYIVTLVMSIVTTITIYVTKKNECFYGVKPLLWLS